MKCQLGGRRPQIGGEALAYAFDFHNGLAGMTVKNTQALTKYLDGITSIDVLNARRIALADGHHKVERHHFDAVLALRTIRRKLHKKRFAYLNRTQPKQLRGLTYTPGICKFVQSLDI